MISLASHLLTLGEISPYLSRPLLPTSPSFFFFFFLQHLTSGNCRASHKETGTTTAILSLRSIQFSSVAESCLTVCDSMDYSTPCFPVHHKLLELTHTHVHQDLGVREFNWLHCQAEQIGRYLGGVNPRALSRSSCFKRLPQCLSFHHQCFVL